ncbi:MAG: response regulator, partial [Proteobacteria bacterium]|nr:response regulator [Pseudomonadota bacterium]
SVEDLLEALFEISRLDAGAIQPELAAIDLDQVVAALRIEFAPLARNQGLTLEIPETGLWVESDVRLLRRVLQNFLSNAIRYTADGSVTIRAEPDGDMVRLAVRDTGPGIARSDRELIFEEFRRLGAIRGIPGKGLGLAIVKRACAMLGHEFGLESELGEGSTFFIRVPRAQPQARSARIAQQRTRSGPDAAGPILIIDNDQAILEGMEALLRNWGYQVTIAAGADDPLAQAAVDRGVDLIIADYHLEDDARGDATIATLRRRARRDIPAIVVTADRSEEVKGLIAEAGFPLLNKPVKPAQLRALLRTIIADRGA